VASGIIEDNAIDRQHHIIVVREVVGVLTRQHFLRGDCIRAADPQGRGREIGRGEGGRMPRGVDSRN
jgi:hypothetical protein